MKLLSGLICALAIWAVPAAASHKITSIQGPDLNGRFCEFFQVDGNPNAWYSFNLTSIANGTTLNPAGDSTKEILLMAWASGQQIDFRPTGGSACGWTEIDTLTISPQ